MRGQGEFRDITCRLMAKCCSLDPQLIAYTMAALRDSETGGYSTIWIPKSSGGRRRINEPILPLKVVQASLLPFFYRWPVDERMFGCRPGCSPVDNARYHIWEIEFGRDKKKIEVVPRWTLSVDLKDAFPSVTADLLEPMFRQMFKKDRLRQFPGLDPADIDSVYEEFIELMLWLTTYRGCVPQGAPTSPYLVNLALVWTGLVERIAELCANRKAPFRFSIYVDDITISSYKIKFTDGFIRKLVRVIEEGGWFKVNPKKTLRNSRKYKAHRITGVVLTTGEDGTPKLTLSQKTLNTWRGIIHRAAVCLREPSLPGLEIDHTTISLALGYVGWIKSIYSGSQMPSSVRSVVEEFDAAWDKLRQERWRSKAKEAWALLEFLRTRLGVG